MVAGRTNIYSDVLLNMTLNVYIHFLLCLPVANVIIQNVMCPVFMRMLLRGY